jgi:hypothetical protein
MNAEVPFVALNREHAAIAPSLDDAFARVVRCGSFILGEEVARFEAAWAAVCGVEHCVGVASGTAALTLMLRAAGIGPGDEVIVPAHTYIASALGVIHAGAQVVLCDVDAGTGTAKPARERHAKLRRAADRTAPSTPPARAAVPVLASPARQAEPANATKDHRGGKSDARPAERGKAAEHGKPAGPPPAPVRTPPGQDAAGQSGANAHGNGPPRPAVPAGVPAKGAGPPPKLPTPPKPPGPPAGESGGPRVPGP